MMQKYVTQKISSIVSNLKPIRGLVTVIHGTIPKTTPFQCSRIHVSCQPIIRKSIGQVESINHNNLCSRHSRCYQTMSEAEFHTISDEALDAVFDYCSQLESLPDDLELDKRYV